MGKITDRREKTAHTVIENKAVLAEGTKPKSEFPYKKLLIAVLVVVAVIACVLLVLNAFVDTYAGKFATGDTHIDAVATVEPSGDLHEKTEELLKNPEFAAAYLAATKNHTTNVSSIKSNSNVYNYVVTISSEQTDADTAGVSIVMIVSMDKTNDKVSYFAINKAMLVEIPTVGVAPIYDAYEFGGAALLTRTVQENFGVEIKGYVDMPLESFVQASLDVGGIKIDDQSLTDDEQNLNTAAKIYNYVKEADDRNAAMTSVVKSLAAKSTEAGIFGLKGTVDSIANSINASIERGDFSELITMLIDMFKNDPAVFQIGYDSSKSVTKKEHALWTEGFAEFITVNYAYEIAKLQANMFPTTK